MRLSADLLLILRATRRGRRSGRLYRPVLEVLRWDSATNEAVVMSGFGPGSDWYLNLMAGGAVEVRIARLRFSPEIRQMEPVEAAAIVADYERRNSIAGPILWMLLSRLAGFRYDGSEEARLRLVGVLPLVALRASDRVSQSENAPSGSSP